MKRNHNYLIILVLAFSTANAATTLVDPTRPPGFNDPAGTIASPNAPLKLNAVLIRPTYRIAIINNQSVMVGDKLGEFTITSITPYTVELVGPENSKQVLQLVTQVKTPR